MVGAGPARTREGVPWRRGDLRSPTRVWHQAIGSAIRDSVKTHMMLDRAALWGVSQASGRVKSRYQELYRIGDL